MTVILDLALYQLVATGIIAALSSVAVGSTPCALSAAVNCIAALHYARIRDERGRDGGDEDCVDRLRYSDWLITLPLMGLELHSIAERADPAYSPTFYAKEFSAFVLFCVVVMGAIWRFADSRYANIGRCIKATCFLASSALMVITLLNLLANARRDLDFLLVFTLPWGLYPVVALAEAAVASDARRPVFKDGLYAALDVWSKAGLALAVALREN